MSSALHLKHIIGQKKKSKKQQTQAKRYLFTPSSIRQETSRKSSFAQPRGFAFSSLIAESDSRYFIIYVPLFPLQAVVAAYFHYMRERENEKNSSCFPRHTHITLLGNHSMTKIITANMSSLLRLEVTTCKKTTYDTAFVFDNPFFLFPFIPFAGESHSTLLASLKYFLCAFSLFHVYGFVVCDGIIPRH